MAKRRQRTRAEIRELKQAEAEISRANDEFNEARCYATARAAAKRCFAAEARVKLIEARWEVDGG